MIILILYYHVIIYYDILLLLLLTYYCVTTQVMSYGFILLTTKAVFDISTIPSSKTNLA